jgi:hypothetical protein
MRNVKRRLRVTLRLQVPLRSPVSVCTFQDARARSSSGSRMSSRNANILRSLSTVSGRYAFTVVLRVEPFQALMDDVPYFHAKPSVACNLTLVKASRRRSGTISSLNLRHRGLGRRRNHHVLVPLGTTLAMVLYGTSVVKERVMATASMSKRRQEGGDETAVR